MKGRMGFLAGLLLVMVLTVGGCSRTGGPPGYMDNLTPGDPDRVLGRFPGVPNEYGMVMVRVIGKGLAPENAANKGQAVILSERAAIADGYRQLAERIRGVYVETYSRVNKGEIEEDKIDLAVSTWLRGARVTRIDRREHGVTAAHMEAKVHIAPDHLRGNRFPRN